MIQEIINKINENITALAQCKINADVNVRAYGLATPIKRKDENHVTFIPAVIHNSGECRYVFSDDNYDLGVYHRILGKTYTEGKSWGREKEMIETAEMLIVVWGFSDKLQQSDLTTEETVITPAFPVENISIVSVNFDKNSVVGTEFKGIDYDFKPEEFIFSVKYRIQTNFMRSCKAHCE